MRRPGKHHRGRAVVLKAPAEVQCRRNRGGGVVKAKLIFIAAIAAALALPFANIIWGDAPSP
jgi:hypothetical protein